MKRDEALIEKIPVDQRWYDVGGQTRNPAELNSHRPHNWFGVIGLSEAQLPWEHLSNTKLIGLLLTIRILKSSGFEIWTNNWKEYINSKAQQCPRRTMLAQHSQIKRTKKKKKKGKLISLQATSKVGYNSLCRLEWRPKAVARSLPVCPGWLAGKCEACCRSGIVR